MKVHCDGDIPRWKCIAMKMHRDWSVLWWRYIMSQVNHNEVASWAMYTTMKRIVVKALHSPCIMTELGLARDRLRMDRMKLSPQVSQYKRPCHWLDRDLKPWLMSIKMWTRNGVWWDWLGAHHLYIKQRMSLKTHKWLRHSWAANREEKIAYWKSWRVLVREETVCVTILPKI